MVLVVTLLLTGILLVIAEVFLPGAVAGIVGALCLLIGVVLAFNQSPTIGLVALAGSCGVGLGAFYLWLKVMPRTAVGRQLFLSKTGKQWQGNDPGLESLMGEYGVTQTFLRPAGTALIAGRRVDVVSQGAMIAAGQRIQVIEVRGNRVLVAEAPAPTSESTVNTPTPPPSLGRSV